MKSKKNQRIDSVCELEIQVIFSDDLDYENKEYLKVLMNDDEVERMLKGL